MRWTTATAYTITAAATSTDVNYNGTPRTCRSPTRTTTRRDHGQPTSGLTTTEAGGTATFTVVLNTQPTGDVSWPGRSATTEGTVLPARLTFTAANWNLAQTVTVTGVDDALDDGDSAYTIVTAPATSTDVTYNGVNAAMSRSPTPTTTCRDHGDADGRADDDRSRWRPPRSPSS